MDLSVVIFYLLLTLLGTAVLSFPYWLLFRLHKWLVAKGYPKVGILLSVAFTTWLFYSLYTGIYPTDSFYLSEFKKVTGTEAPASAVIVRGEASYPDFHGDYCSATLVTLSERDFQELLFQMKANYQLEATGTGPMGGSRELEHVLGNRRKEKLLHSFRRTVFIKSDQYWEIGFFTDRKTVVIQLCNT